MFTCLRIASVSVIESSYEELKEDVLRMKERGQVVLLGDFNARVGRSSELDDVIGMFGERKCNASGNRMISFLTEVELVICNGREFNVESQWTRARPSLKQKSIIDYIVTDSNLLQVSGSVQVDDTDIGKSDHFLVWMELGRTVKTAKQQKRVIKKWRIERFQEEEVRQQYQEALSVEVEVFQERIQTRKHQGLRGSELVKAVVQDWEDTVKRVASKEIGEKVIVCGKAARWWDAEIKDKIRLRRQVYKEIQSGREDKWGQYYKLRSEIKELVRKKLDSWNEVIEKANKDFDVNKKEFWAFVGRTSKGSRKSIASLRSSSGSCVTSTKGKLEVLHEHYGKLGTASVDDQFDDSWREHVESKVTEYSEMSSARKDKVLD